VGLLEEQGRIPEPGPVQQAPIQQVDQKLYRIVRQLAQHVRYQELEELEDLVLSEVPPRHPHRLGHPLVGHRLDLPLDRLGLLFGRLPRLVLLRGLGQPHQVLQRGGLDAHHVRVHGEGRRLALHLEGVHFARVRRAQRRTFVVFAFVVARQEHLAALLVVEEGPLEGLQVADAEPGDQHRAQGRLLRGGHGGRRGGGQAGASREGAICGKKGNSRAWFRSTDRWVTGPERYHCATLLVGKGGKTGFLP
jgi:hypothetical protein